MGQPNLAAAENGRRPVPAAIWPAIERLEQLVADLTEDMCATAVDTTDAVVWLDTYATDAQLLARGRRRYAGVPVEVHRVATARAAASLTAAGRVARIRLPE